MDEEKKKKLNDAIAVIRAFCMEQLSCDNCPLSYYDISEAVYYCDYPNMWEEIE